MILLELFRKKGNTMAINPNRPVQKSNDTTQSKSPKAAGALEKAAGKMEEAAQSLQQMNQVTGTALEALTDKIYDADKDSTHFGDVKAAYEKLSDAEKVAFAAGGILTGGALPAISLIVEETAKAGAAISKTFGEAVKQRYSHPPEEKLIESVKKGAQKVANKVEEKVDDLKDGRVGRDLKKDVKRTLRDTFTERTPMEKAVDAVKDAAQDAGDALGDVFDDLKDGRLGRKLGL